MMRPVRSLPWMQWMMIGRFSACANTRRARAMGRIDCSAMQQYTYWRPRQSPRISMFTLHAMTVHKALGSTGKLRLTCSNKRVDRGQEPNPSNGCHGAREQRRT